jgi:hypothetical protein
MDAPRESLVVLCDVSCAQPDAATVDELARMLLCAKRRGYSLRLCNASPQLLELIDFMGLRRTFGASVEARW